MRLAVALAVGALLHGADAQAPPKKKVHTDPCSISNVFKHLNAIKSSPDCRAGCHGKKCPPNWTPGKGDKCNAKCGAIFEPFWDQCGQMLTAAKMGGMKEMGFFYHSCLRNLYPAGSCGAFCTQHTYDCYLKEVHAACCDEDGANCNTQSPVPQTCPVGCGLVFPTFLENCRNHIKQHQTESWCHSAKCIDLKQFEAFEKKCLAIDGMALVEYALEMKDKGCTINLGDVQKSPQNPFGRRLQHIVPKNAFLSKWLDTDDTGACDWDKIDDFSNEVDRICCGKDGANCKNGGVPSKCTPGCAVTFNQFTKSCGSTLARIFPAKDPRRATIFAFAAKCKPTDPKFFLKAINAAKCPKGVTIGRSPPPPPLAPGMCEITVNSALNGPIVGNGLPGWTSHHAVLSIVDWDGQRSVLKNADAGSFSDVYQHIKTIPGASYTIRYSVWAHPIVNTAHKKYCSTTDSNGLLDITNGAITNLEQHGQLRLCPDKDGEWEKVVDTFKATTAETTLR